MKHPHTVDELCAKIDKELSDAGRKGYFTSTGSMPDPGFPNGVGPNTDLDDVADDSASDPRRKSPQGRVVEAGVLSKSPFQQVIEHSIATVRKFGHEKPDEFPTTTVQPEELDSLIKSVGRLEERLKTVADQVEKIAKKK